MEIAIRFDRGTIDLGAAKPRLEGVVFDPRTRSHRLSAHRFAELASRADDYGVVLTGDLRRSWTKPEVAPPPIELRTYQEQALASWKAFGRKGLVVLPTGAGKTRVAIAAIADTKLPAVVLVPTRALASAWIRELFDRLNEPIGLVGDGERRVERITVMTFESAYRRMDAFGDRFGMLVVDEVHHFASGARIEALESCAAVARLGLTATAPEPWSEGVRMLDALVGPIVFELGYADLVGKHLAPLRMMTMLVRLDDDERTLYEESTRGFRELRRTFMRAHPGADLPALLRGIAALPGGGRALRDHARAQELAGFPRSKRAIVRELLARHRAEKTLVFTSHCENAYTLSVDNLVPVITGDTSARERTDILAKFREGKVRAIVSARVLNEGIDVPDARVAIVVAGVQGVREHVQRIGRVLRPAPGKEALVYELVTRATSDARRAQLRAGHVPGTPPRD